MTEHTDDIKKTIRIAKAIENDICEYKSFDVQAAYQKNRKRLDAERKKHSFIFYISRIAAILLLPLIISTGVLSYLYTQQLRQVETVSYLEALSAPGIVTRVLLPDSSKVTKNQFTFFPSCFLFNIDSTGSKMPIFLIITDLFIRF